MVLQIKCAIISQITCHKQPWACSSVWNSLSIIRESFCVHFKCGGVIKVVLEDCMPLCKINQIKRFSLNPLPVLLSLGQVDLDLFQRRRDWFHNFKKWFYMLKSISKCVSTHFLIWLLLFLSTDYPCELNYSGLNRTYMLITIECFITPRKYNDL